MAGYNHCVFVGRVGKDPQLNQTNEGVSYCRFRLAVDLKLSPWMCASWNKSQEKTHTSKAEVQLQTGRQPKRERLGYQEKQGREGG